VTNISIKLPLCVIDAVYSVGVKYEAVSKCLLNTIASYFSHREFRELRDQVPPTSEQQPLSDLLDKMGVHGIEKFTILSSTTGSELPQEVES